MRRRGWKAQVLAGLIAGALLPACGGQGASGGGAVKVQISGEDFATDGFKFPEGSEDTIADGWQIEFSHVFVTIGRAWLSDSPNLDPFDQSRTGDTIAELAGPWIIDLHAEGAELGAGGEGTAVLLGVIEDQNKKGGAPLPAGEAFAFSFETAAATAAAKAMNFQEDAETAALRGEMVSGGYSVYYVGRATFKGQSCQTSDPAYDFTKIPTTIDFKLGFSTPSASINCQNQENPGEPFEGEEYQRGVIIRAGEESLAQMTFHLEHAFYSAVTHEPGLYFDQLAARLVGKPQGTVLTMDDAAGVDPKRFTDGEGAALPWRACDGSAVPAPKERYFDSGTLPVDPAADPAKALRDYRDFIHYVQSAQGHMNGGEGICFTKRTYPSPP